MVWERHPSRPDAVMLWAASTLCFFAFLRMGEAVAPSDSGFDARYHLTYGDVRSNSCATPSWMEVRIKCSKWDQFCKGVTLSMEATKTSICSCRNAGIPGSAGRYTTRPPLNLCGWSSTDQKAFVSALRAGMALIRRHMQGTVFEWAQPPPQRLVDSWTLSLRHWGVGIAQHILSTSKLQGSQVPS